ncbi:class I SAM-dependent methyltransferase, partial [Leucobacter soli]
RAALSLNPVRVADDSRLAAPLDWWILSDLDDQLRNGPAHPDHVMGVGGATRSLIAQLPPHDAGRALDLGSADSPRSLDLGTGCGIVAMHLALRGPVVATDISERALDLARANARLNGMEHGIEFRHGDLFAPVTGERFDLIASNPPFVITPRGEASVADDPIYAYRDGGRTGDELAASVVREAPAHLAPGGVFLCLANWETPWGGDGLERVRNWIAAASDAAPSPALDAWVIERDRIDPARYAETWARDGGARPGDPEFEALMRAWLDDFAARRVVAIGLGSIRIARAERDPSAADGVGDAGEQGVTRTEQATGAYLADGGLGSRLSAAFHAGTRAARMGPAEVLATHWLRSDEVVELREHAPGEESPR